MAEKLVRVSSKEKERMRQLIFLLERWRYERYFLFQETVSLEVYDAHFEELLALEKKYQYSLPNSLTKKVGIVSSKDLQLVERQIPMLSLDSVDNYSKLQKWEDTIKKKIGENSDLSFLCEWKIDGLSLSLLYQDSKLVKISTRGDGYRGSDLTFNKRFVKNIPLFLPKAGNYEIRGEVFMSKEDFTLLNKSLKEAGEPVLTSLRNAAAGTIHSISPPENRSLSFFAFSLFGVNLVSQEDCLRELHSLGFSTSPYQLCNGLLEVQEFISQGFILREKLGFSCDGIVIKLNDYELYSKVGQTSRFPYWAVAYKFPASTGYGVLRSITVEVSRNGRVSYVAEIEPIRLLGSLIRRITLHNYSFIKQKRINIGDEIVVRKSGDVIPQVIQVIKLTEADSVWVPPEFCPFCQSVLVWNESSVYQLCLNEDCVRKNINYLTYFVSKEGMNIKGVSKKTIEKLYNSGILKQPVDFYSLEERRDQILQLEGVKERTVDNILLSVNNSLKQPFSCLLSSLSIPLLSRIKSNQLSVFFSNIDEFIESLSNGEWEKIKWVVGEKTSQEIRNFWNDLKRRETLLAFKNIFSKN